MVIGTTAHKIRPKTSVIIRGQKEGFGYRDTDTEGEKSK